MSSQPREKIHLRCASEAWAPRLVKRAGFEAGRAIRVKMGQPPHQAKDNMDAVRGMEALATCLELDQVKGRRRQVNNEVSVTIPQLC